MNEKVYIVILNWNSWEDTIECLESVFSQQHKDWVAIVCDNDSSDGSIEKIQDWANGDIHVTHSNHLTISSLFKSTQPKPISYQLIDRVEAENNLNRHEDQLVIIQTGGNLGFAGGTNVGIRYAMTFEDCSHLWLLNNDTVVDKKCLSEMLTYSKSQDKKNCCGSVLFYYNSPATVQGYGGCSYNKWTGLASTSFGRDSLLSESVDHSDYEKKLDYISGASWLMPRQAILDIGLLSEDYFLYCEEIDWCIRNNNEYSLCYSPDAYVYHKEGNSIGSPNDKRPSSLLSDFYIFRNKLWLTKKYYPFALLTTYVVTLLQAFNRVRCGRLDKAVLIIKIVLGKKKFSTPKE